MQAWSCGCRNHQQIPCSQVLVSGQDATSGTWFLTKRFFSKPILPLHASSQLTTPAISKGKSEKMTTSVCKYWSLLEQQNWGKLWMPEIEAQGSSTTRPLYEMNLFERSGRLMSLVMLLADCELAYFDIILQFSCLSLSAVHLWSSHWCPLAQVKKHVLYNITLLFL